MTKYELERGDTRQAIEATPRNSRALIAELLDDRDTEVELGPGDLRRSERAAVTRSPGTAR